MNRVLFYSFLLSLFIPGVLFAQRDSSRTDFLDAESWFLFEEYADALPLYMRLYRRDPGNDNLKYKIGICLLNDPYQKDKAIGYLLDASDNINPNYKENSFKEQTAPPDVLYYLGNAYLVNELLEMAIESYEQFLEMMDRDVYDEELVQTQIRACKNAQRLKTMPVDIDLTILDSLINTRYSDIRPVVSGDGTKLAFVTELPFYDGAFYCEKTDEGWSYPQSITTSLGYDADIYPAGLSHDGTEMILYYDDDYIGNLYYSQFEDGRWLPAVKLGENISTKYWESHACFSRDGQTLYFTSNRKGTHGGLDIYKSDRQADGKWGPPENLGPTINSRYNEETPFITGDGQTLYFSSYGHYNMGGYDIFFSKKKADGSWGEPINLGYPINTTDDDLFFQPINNGFEAYYSIYSNKGRGRHDIYYMDIYSVDNPRMYLVSGNLRTEDGSIDTAQIAIFVVDSRTGDTIMYGSPDEETGAFGFNLQQGLYELHFTGTGYEELIRPLNITSVSNKQGIRLDGDIELSLVRKESLVFVGEESQIQLKDTLYEGVAGETIEVPLKLQKGSILITKVYQDSVLVSVDTIEVDKRRTTLEIEPLPGTSRVELEMIDSDGNIHKNSFIVIGKEPRKASTAAAGQQRLKSEVESGQAEALLLLADAVANGDASLLYRHLLENSEGSLKSYLESLDLDQAGIHTPEDLIRHLEEAAQGHGFTMDDVRAAMLIGLDEPLEVDRIDDELLEISGDPGDRKGWPVAVAGLSGAGCLLLIILWWIRRKNRRNSTE
ncbi:MAG: PD40 domain-containing protein [Bacteroidales bacterium]|nr:PD40 domain-containing protein [Bacteroidales bacterium]